MPLPLQGLSRETNCPQGSTLGYIMIVSLGLDSEDHFLEFYSFS